MSMHSDCNCSAARAAPQPSAIPMAGHPTPASTCPSSPDAITSPDRQRPELAAETAQQEPEKRRRKKGPAPKQLYAGIKGKHVDIPGWVFGVEIPELFYRGVVIGKDPSHTGCVVVRMEDGQRYYFPAPEVTEWLEDMLQRISPQPGATLGAACDRFAAETLASMSTAAMSDSSGGEADDVGTPAWRAPWGAAGPKQRGLQQRLYSVAGEVCAAGTRGGAGGGCSSKGGPGKRKWGVRERGEKGDGLVGDSENVLQLLEDPRVRELLRGVQGGRGLGGKGRGRGRGGMAAGLGRGQGGKGRGMAAGLGRGQGGKGRGRGRGRGLHRAESAC